MFQILLVREKSFSKSSFAIESLTLSPSSVSVLEGDDAVLEFSALEDEEDEGEEKEQKEEIPEERKLRRSSSAEEKQEILKILEDLKLIKYWSILKDFTVPALRGISVLEMKEHLGIPLPDGLAIYRVLHPGTYCLLNCSLCLTLFKHRFTQVLSSQCLLLCLHLIVCVDVDRLLHLMECKQCENATASKEHK